MTVIYKFEGLKHGFLYFSTFNFQEPCVHDHIIHYELLDEERTHNEITQYDIVLCSKNCILPIEWEQTHLKSRDKYLYKFINSVIRFALSDFNKGDAGFVSDFFFEVQN